MTAPVIDLSHLPMREQAIAAFACGWFVGRYMSVKGIADLYPTLRTSHR